MLEKHKYTVGQALRVKDFPESTKVTVFQCRGFGYVVKYQDSNGEWKTEQFAEDQLEPMPEESDAPALFSDNPKDRLLTKNDIPGIKMPDSVRPFRQ